MDTSSIAEFNRSRRDSAIGLAMGRLFAIGDIHLSYKSNREALETLEPHPDDGLILAGDVGETLDHLREAFTKAKECFKHVFWIPGNHELYSTPKDAESNLRGEAKYQACVSLAREYSILTPEDDFPIWEYTDTNGEVQKAVIALTFTLYDYSFRPAHVSREQALDWAMEEGIRATDETLLHPDPWPTRDEWCAHRISFSEQKLRTAAATGLPLIIVNHWPLRQDTCHIPAVPRFSIWCGTTKTENWHKEFNAKVVVTGHLHVRRTDWIDGVRFEETSLGYPRQWNTAKEKGMTINTVLREILPGPSTPAEGEDIPTKWRYYG